MRTGIIRISAFGNSGLAKGGSGDALSGILCGIMATNGYSYLLPALAAGLSQKDLVNVKKLENTLLDLRNQLIPLQTSYTESGAGEVGRPKLSVDEKSPKTLQNEESLDKQ